MTTVTTGADPVHSATGLKEIDWSECLESVREGKDVECTFGIPKNRIRWLKNAICYHDEDTVVKGRLYCEPFSYSEH